MLHAWKLVFKHPRTAKALAFEAPWPADFEGVLSALSERGQSQRLTQREPSRSL
jgi:hypothetical protein